MNPKTRPPVEKVSGFMIAANYLPLVYILAGVAVVAGLPWTIGQQVTAALVWVYLVPPVVARIVLITLGAPVARDAAPATRAYKVWWLLTQLQMPFNRLPVLEELLRLIPTAYPLWLNLWGARASLFVYWAPGVLITDRYLLDAGHGAVIGTRAIVSGHLATRGPDGGHRLTVARVVVEPGAVIGAHAGIGPGCRIAAGEMVPAGRLLPPFTVWESGRKQRPAGTAAP